MLPGWCLCLFIIDVIRLYQGRLLSGLPNAYGLSQPALGQTGPGPISSNKLSSATSRVASADGYLSQGVMESPVGCNIVFDTFILKSSVDNAHMWEPQAGWNRCNLILFYSTLPFSTLLHSTLLYSTLLYSTLLYSTLLYSTPLHSTPLHSTPLHSTLFYSILFYSILFYSILFYSILFYSILFYSVLFCSVLFCC